MNRINRKRARTWMAWLLPALFLRSLIPIGFMPMFVAGQGVELALCDAYAPVPSMSPDMPMAPGMDMHHGSHQDHSPCPYGSSPALGAPLALLSPATLPQPITELLSTSAQVSYYQTPIRAQTARGPPV